MKSVTRLVHRRRIPRSIYSSDTLEKRTQADAFHYDTSAQATIFRNAIAVIIVPYQRWLVTLIFRIDLWPFRTVPLGMEVQGYSCHAL